VQPETSGRDCEGIGGAVEAIFDEETSSVNKQLKEAWIEALRSGEYEQGKQQMETKDGRLCCLAVLCRVAKVEYPRDAFDLDNEKLQEFRDECCLGDHSCGIQAQLIDLNDDQNKSFPEIADWIEANVPAQS
jgi:hypothetical protein